MSQKSSAAGAMPKGDVSYLRATPGPILPVAPSPLPGRDSNHTPGAPQPHNANSDLEDRLELQQRELEEVRARASQMEKTMRWWSDCTANWREKWSKVRNERNKAREENRQLRAKLDSCIKEMNNLKRERDDLVSKSNSNVSKVSDKHPLVDPSTKPMSLTTSIDKNISAASITDASNSETTSKELPGTDNTIKISTDEIETECARLEIVEPLSDFSISASTSASSIMMPETSGGLAQDKLALLEMKLDESQKTIAAERAEKNQIAKSLEESERLVTSWRVKCEEMKAARQDWESQVERIKEVHRDELTRVVSDLEEEQTSKTSMDRRLSELRAELEKLQKENADEWGRRERLDTEKQALERENKKLRVQISDLEEQLERKSSHATTVVNKDMKTLQMEVSEKTKELADLKHVQMKLKKTLQDRTTDLEHSKRRCDQFEMEVKRLRGRVEELKRELAAAEDEVDKQSNNVRKVQRTCDELQEQMENLQLQVEHLQSRLRRSSQTTGSAGHGGSRSYSPDLQALEIDDDTDDDFSEGI